MEDASLWSVSSVSFPVILICYFLYHIIRPLWKVMVNCWFCNENIRVSYCSQKAFICPKCGQYNGFKEDGDYDRFIPEQKYEFLNPLPEKSGLCQRCSVQQARVQSQINKFEPQNEADFDDELEVYKARLHKSYPLCNGCKEESGLNQLQITRTVSVPTSVHRYGQSSQKHFSEISEVPRRGCSRRRSRAALFNCGLISNCLNMLFDLSQLLPYYVFSSWIPFLMQHVSKVILLGFVLHITAVSVTHARRSLPDIVYLVIPKSNEEGEKQELLLSQLSFVSIQCVVSFAVTFFPRKLLHRKRSNNIMQRSISSRELTPARELGKLFNCLSLGDDLTSSKGTSTLRQRRGPFDSMKKPVLAEPRLRIHDMQDGIFLNNDMHISASRCVKSFVPSTMTAIMYGVLRVHSTGLITLLL
ncbi:BMA-SAMP-1 [Dirofilaria immitis]|nr:BMA-SAMP-1 [Dirofilaria immitis]